MTDWSIPGLDSQAVADPDSEADVNTSDKQPPATTDQTESSGDLSQQ